MAQIHCYIKWVYLHRTTLFEWVENELLIKDEYFLEEVKSYLVLALMKDVKTFMQIPDRAMPGLLNLGIVEFFFDVNDLTKNPLPVIRTSKGNFCKW